MKVYIIGAGPGDPELITIKGAKLVETCPIILYTGSLVPKAVIKRAKKEAIVLDSSNMTLDEIISIILSAKNNNQDVARVHTGDPSIFGSIAEQIRKLDLLNIQYEIVPGVSSFTAAAAVLGKELTLPEVSQTIIITRIAGRTPVPERERLEILAQSGATLTLFFKRFTYSNNCRTTKPILRRKMSSGSHSKSDLARTKNRHWNVRRYCI